MLKLSNTAFTFAFLKPETTAYPLICWSVIENILSSRFNIVAAKWHKMKRIEAENFYGVHKERFFYERLVRHVISGSLITMLLISDENNVIERWRNLIGGTKVFKTIIEQPNSLRGRFGLTDTRNAFHGSDSIQNATDEMKFFFPDLDFSAELRPLSLEDLHKLVFVNKIPPPSLSLDICK